MTRIIAGIDVQPTIEQLKGIAKEIEKLRNERSNEINTHNKIGKLGNLNEKISGISGSIWQNTNDYHKIEIALVDSLNDHAYALMSVEAFDEIEVLQKELQVILMQVLDGKTD